jgi:hypothetical protein
VICDDLTARLTAGWRAEPTFDYVALVWDQPPGRTVREESGTRCAGASEPQACEAAVAAVVPATYWTKGAPVGFQEFFVYTRGDDVGTIGSLTELQQALGNIDTPNEAAVWLYAQDRPAHCDQLETVPDGYRAYLRAEVDDCPYTYQSVEIHVARDGTLAETPVGEPIVTNACAGRRAEGLQVAAGARAGGELGNCFAEMAELELASIAAFATLEAQLVAHGAPEPLIERCRAARGDEMRHARALSALAHRFGAWPKWIRALPQQRRSLLELALENAREGRVRELYGAAVATWQAQHAQDREVREVFGAVALDEAEHAALALDLGVWLASQLTQAERELVEVQRQRALAELGAELHSSPHPSVQTIAGMPSAAQAKRLLAGTQPLS